MYKELIILNRGNNRLQKTYDLLNKINVRYTESIDECKLFIHEDENLSYRNSVIVETILKYKLKSNNSGVLEYLVLHLMYSVKGVLRLTSNNLIIKQSSGEINIDLTNFNKEEKININILGYDYMLCVGNLVDIVTGKLTLDTLSANNKSISSLGGRNVFVTLDFKTPISQVNNSNTNNNNIHPKDYISDTDYMFNEDDYLTENEKLIKRLNDEALKKLKGGRR